MYLILTKAKGSRPQSWCTCEDRDIHGALLELVANGYTRDDDIYMLYLTETNSLPISHKLKLKALTNEIGVQPLNLAHRTESAAIPPEPAIEQPAAPIPTSQTPFAAPVSQVNPPISAVSQPEPEIVQESAPEPERKAPAATSVNDFVSNTPARFSYLDRLSPRVEETESNDIAPHTDDAIETEDKKAASSCAFRAKPNVAPIPMEQRTTIKLFHEKTK